MALTFVLLKESPNKAYKPKKLIHKTAKTWAEIESLTKQDFPPVSRNFFNMIKTLEATKEFRDGILNIRKRHNIPPGGYPVKQLLEELLSHPSNKKVSGLHLPPINSLMDYPIDFKDYLDHRRDYDPQIDLAQQRLPIIYGNCVVTSFLFVEEPVVSLEQQTIGHTARTQIHVVFQRQVRTEDIIRYFTKNAYEIQRMMQLLPPKNTFDVSERDLRIYKLRKEQGKRYQEIAESIIKEFNLDDPEERINENSVLQAFKKTNHKISSLLVPLNLT